MKRMKKILSLLLAGALVLNTGSITSFASAKEEILDAEYTATREREWLEGIQQESWSVDEETKWNWLSKYGEDGYVLCAWDSTKDVNHFPYYIDSVEYLTEDRSGGYVARNANTEKGNTAWWQYGLPSEEDPEGTRKISYHFDDKQQTVRIMANDKDEHVLTFYSVTENDWDREVEIQLYKAGTKEKIGEPVILEKLMEGKYISIKFQGSVDVVLTNNNYNPAKTNTVVNGIFFDTYFAGEVPVRRVSIAPEDGETVRKAGDEIQMTATIFPKNAANQKLTWSILPEGTDVASVDENGKVTVNKAGTFSVRAVSHDADVWDEASMTCIEQAQAPEKAEWSYLGEDYVILQNREVRVVFELNTGRYSIYEQSSGNPYVLGAYYQVNGDKSTKGYTFEVEEIEEQEEGKTLRFTGSKEGTYGIILDVSLEDDGGDILLKAGIENTLDEGVKVMQMYPMAAKYQEKGGIFVGPDPAENHSVLTGEGNWTVPQVKQSVDTTSKNNLMISYRDEPNRESFLIGQLTTYSFQSTITTNYDPEAALSNHGCKSIDGDIRIYDNTGKLVDAGQTYVGDTALLNFTEKNPYDSLEQYAVRQAEAMDVQLLDFDPYIYECLWYVNWFDKNANNADFAVQEVKDLYTKGLANYAKPNLRVEPDTYVNPNEQLWWDDAHWKKFGHLTDSYPTMKEWVAAMQEAGGEAGTYMQASYRSDDYCAEYPGHMLYNNEKEGPDYTDPDFIQHMSEVYANLKDAGIRSIFYDYAGLYRGTSGGWLLNKTGGFEDEHATAVEAYRNIFALPKTYIGRDVRITENSWENSGSDVAIGLIDLQRNIHDTNEFTPAIAQPAVNQWYRHRTTKLLYPDVKVFENNDIDLRRAQITGTAFLFGKTTLGESVNRMSDDKIKDIGKSVPFPINGVSARPVGLFEDDYVEKGLTNPEVLDYKFKSDFDDHILLFWNETTKSKTISADLGKDTTFGGIGLDPEKEYDVWDFWDWNYIGRVKGSETLSLPVRKNEMKTMAVREVRDTPYVLSTNRHVLQGTQEIEAKDITWNAQEHTLTGTFEIVANDTFKAIIPVPEGLILTSFETENEEVEASAEFNNAGRYVEVVLADDVNQSVPFVMTFEEGETPKDTEAPTAISDLRATADDYGYVTLTWEPSTDESGSVSYEVYGATAEEFAQGISTRVAITTAPTYTAGDPPAGDYYYTVVAKDAGGNKGISATVRTNAISTVIPVEQLEATCGDNQEKDKPENVLDGSQATLWHTSWNGTVPRDKMWIDLHIKNGPTMVSSVKYLPRDNSTLNGIFVRYRVDISTDNGKTYQTLIEDGSFESTSGWQTITFDEAVEVTNVRLYCLESADPGQQWASAAELRLYNMPEFEGISMREEEVALKVGDTKTMLVDFFPTNYNKPVTFESDNENVATVDEDGVVTAVAEGTANITATAEGKMATCVVYVGELAEIQGAAKKAKEAAEIARQAASDAEEAQRAAEEARVAAEDAQKAAEQAAETAGEDSEAAKQAKLAAEEAADRAEKAEKLAEDARKAAETAAQASQDAQKAAEEAQAGAEDAEKKAEEARDAAQQAQKTAEEAKNAASESAESAKGYAEQAEAAKDQAVAAKDDAVKAQEAAEKAQESAEQAASDAEEAQKKAEEARTAAEEAQKKAEQAVNTAGADSAAAEQAKTAAEAAASRAEAAEKLAEEAKAAAEQSAKAAKDAQTAAADAKTGAEGAKQRAEEARDAALQAQQTVEGLKNAVFESVESAKKYAELAEAAKNLAEAAKEETLKAQAAAEKAQKIAEEKAREAEAAIRQAEQLKNEMEEMLVRARFESEKVSIKAVKSSKKKQAKVTWKKVDGAEGYIVEYALKANFKGAKTAAVKKGTAVSKTLKKLKSKKTYYVRVKAYKTVNGEKIYTATGAKKKVRVK